MKIKKHLCFSERDDPEIARYLKDNGIPYDGGEDNIICAVDIFESDPHWEYISRFVQEKGLLCLSDTIFTKKELESAEWLKMWSGWRFGYPQPEGDFEYETITYTREGYCEKCGRDLRQVAPFRIKKAPKWGKRHFAELNWIGDELFLDDVAREILIKSGATGVEFKEVLNKQGTGSFSDVHQLVAPTILRDGLIEDCSAIREIERCPRCGKKKYITSGVGCLAFEKSIFEGVPDVVKTAEYFGSGYYAGRIMIVRQKVYRTITENQLGRGLNFEPIELV